MIQRKATSFVPEKDGFVANLSPEARSRSNLGMGEVTESIHPSMWSFGMTDLVQTNTRTRPQRGKGARITNKKGNGHYSKGNSEQTYVRRACLAQATLLDGKWKVKILCAMREGPVRLGQLARLIPNVSRKMLVQNLRSLEATGIVVRRDLSDDVLLHVEYYLEPDLRESICRVLDELSNWGGLYSHNSMGDGSLIEAGLKETVSGL